MSTITLFWSAASSVFTAASSFSVSPPRARRPETVTTATPLSNRFVSTAIVRGYFSTPRARYAVPRLVLRRGLLNVIDGDQLHVALSGFQFESELRLQGAKESGEHFALGHKDRIAHSPARKRGHSGHRPHRPHQSVHTLRRKGQC